jgi:cytochrome P450
MIVAGHETTANTLHFALLELAINPAAQRRLQADVDKIFGDTDPSSWNYDRSVNALLASSIGASMNEMLRLMPPVVGIPKEVTPGADQVLTIGGRKCVLPAGFDIELAVVAVHRNPRYWPGQPSKLVDSASDLDDFVPERWFRKSQEEKEDAAEEVDTQDFGGFRGPDTSPSLFRPARGSFIPFSDGARSCLGRRIAQVELIAVLATIFQKHSVELDVGEWVAGDDEVEKMGRDERMRVYAKAQDKGRATMRSARSVITLKFHGAEFVPIRLVPRGEERFVNFI